MLIYDAAYNSVKSKYLIPLTDFSLSFSALDNLGIKSALLSVHNVTKNTNGEYEFRLDKDDLFKAILSDIQKFYLRLIIHERDLNHCCSDIISPNWNIVTYYYNAFFRASLFLRLCFKGNIYLDNAYIRELNSVLTFCMGVPVNLNNNMFYEIRFEPITNEYVLFLSPNNSNTHELVWIKTNEAIQDIAINSQAQSDERTILHNIIEMNNHFGCKYPSSLRNAVNYQPNYGLECICNRLYNIEDHPQDWHTRILYFTRSENKADMNKLAYYLYSYSEYIGWFCKNLIAEYYYLRGCENSIKKAYVRKFGEELDSDPCFSF